MLKRKPKPKKTKVKKHVSRPRVVVTDETYLRSKKKLITKTLEGLIAGAIPAHREELLEDLIDYSLFMLGAVTGIDTSEAVMLIPEDQTAKLLRAISIRADLTGVSPEDICNALVLKLDHADSAQLAN